MATKLFLRSTSTTGIGATYFDMVTTAGASLATAQTNTAASGTEIQWASVGTPIQWVSGRVPAGGFTLTSTNISIWANESATQANCGGRFRVFKRTSGGTETEVGGGPFDLGSEFATSATEYTWTGNVTDTAFAEDDRIVLKIYLTNIGTMGSGRTCTLTFNQPDASTGDSFFNIAETVAFKAEPIPAADGWNYADKGANVTLSNSDRTATFSGFDGVRSTTTHVNGTAGKYYAEFYINAIVAVEVFGLVKTSASLTEVSAAWGVQTDNGRITIDGVAGPFLGAFAVNDVVCVAWDAGARLIWFRLNSGNWNASGSADPGSGAGGVAVTADSVAYALRMRAAGVGDALTVRAKIADYTLTAPTGFLSWIGETISAGSSATKVKHSGTWKTATTWVKHSGTWKTATPWVKHSGTWKQA